MSNFETERRRALEQLAREIADINSLMENLRRIKGIRQSPASNHGDWFPEDQWERLIASRRYRESNKFLCTNGTCE